MIQQDHSTSERGQSLVETALLFPILLLILIGIVDLGRVYYSYLQLTNAAREGARWAGSNPTDIVGAKDKAVNAANNSGISITTSNVTVSGGNNSGDTKTVTINLTFPLLTFYIFGVGSIPIQNSAIMTVMPGAAP